MSNTTPSPALESHRPTLRSYFGTFPGNVARSSAAPLGMTTICSAELITGRSMRNDLPPGATSAPVTPSSDESYGSAVVPPFAPRPCGQLRITISLLSAFAPSALIDRKSVV